MENILVVYFSGTGGTEMIATALEQKLNEKGCSAKSFSLDLSKVKSLSDANDNIKDIDRIIVAYPVYSYDAPLPVHRWIDTLQQSDGTKASVLSISAGGEAFTNRTSRKHCIKSLESKGFDVDYERMITMPSNYGKTASDDINILLIKAVPVITESIADDIVNNVALRERKKFAVAPAIAAGVFKSFATDFGKKLAANEDCTNCSWCEKNCPTQNLTITDGQLSASDQCTLCLRCVYGCPTNAIYSQSYGFSIVKEGFDIKSLTQKANKTDVMEKHKIDNIKAGHMWKGALEYIKEVL